MQEASTLDTDTMDHRPTSWGGVLAMSLGAFVLVASEFMPVSLLTPIAADLDVTEVLVVLTSRRDGTTA